MKNSTLWKVIAVIEVIIAIVVVAFDLFIPTIVLLGVMIVSLLIRREGLSTIGFKRPANFKAMLLFVLCAVVIWSLLQLGLITPILNHLTGNLRDVTDFADLKGNLGQMLLLLLLTWTVAGFGEEIVYRGYIQRRVTDLLGEGALGVAVAIGLSSALFGLAHTEQGIVGVVSTFIDALFFSWLKRRFNGNLWATILAHGLINTIGIVAYFLVGPIAAFW